VNDVGTGVLWTGNLTVDVDAALAILGIPAQATKVRLSLDNTLVATSETGSGSFIAKKDIPIKIDVTVPEPATWVLAGFAALGLGLARRR
jgi:PEP-CTERM motif